MSVSDEIIKVFDAFAERFGIVIDWTSTNAMPYFEQLCDKFIKYEIATTILWLVIDCIGLFVAFYLYGKFKTFMQKHKEDRYAGWDIAAILTIIAAIVLTTLCVIDIPINITKIIECAIFPEMTIFNELKDLLSGIS